MELKLICPACRRNGAKTPGALFGKPDDEQLYRSGCGHSVADIVTALAEAEQERNRAANLNLGECPFPLPSPVRETWGWTDHVLNQLVRQAAREKAEEVWREQQSRTDEPLIIDLDPYLDGTYEIPTPSIGAINDLGKQLLYPGKWHTLVSPNGLGKSWLAVLHARDEILNRTRDVVYVHFEEGPHETIQRLIQLGVPVWMIRKHLRWLSPKRSLDLKSYGAYLEGLQPSLVILDGINAACGSLGMDPERVSTVGTYVQHLVEPATATGAATLSLGHPVKASDRQGERHGFGSTGWLDQVDGVAFRLLPSQSAPIRRGHKGHVSMFSVKDRSGTVERDGQPHEKYAGWFYLGSMIIDDQAPDRTTARVSVPMFSETGTAPSPNDSDDLEVLDAVKVILDGGGETTTRAIRAVAQIRGTRVDEGLERLTLSGRLVRFTGPRNSIQYQLGSDPLSSQPTVSRRSTSD